MLTHPLNGKTFDHPDYGTVRIEAGGYYEGHRLALEIFTDDGEPLCTLTVNIPEAPLAEDEILVKTWSENEITARAARLSGFFLDTGRRVKTGYVEAQVWKVL